MCQSQIARNEWVYHFIARIRRQHLFSWTAYRLGNFRFFLYWRSCSCWQNKFILKWIGNLFAFAPFSHYLRNTKYDAPPIRCIDAASHLTTGRKKTSITMTNIDLSAMVYLCGSVCCGCQRRISFHHRQNFCRFLYFSFDFNTRTFCAQQRAFGELGCVASSIQVCIYNFQAYVVFVGTPIKFTYRDLPRKHYELSWFSYPIPNRWRTHTHTPQRGWMKNVYSIIERYEVRK